MRVSEALAQLEVIHDHLSRSETYRGFRAGSVAFTGVLGWVAAHLQDYFVTWEPLAFVAYWTVLAILCSLPSIGTAVYCRFFHEEGLARRRSDRVAAQFLPCLAAGIVVTVAFARAGPGLIPYLPGLWALLFALGVFALRPYLPRLVGWIGLFYLIAGAWLLGLPFENYNSPSPGSLPSLPPGWTVGGVFGVGHLALALILSFNSLNSKEREYV